ncbi:MAG: pyruvate dehydrogenase [Planctomycetes bacterium]|nr:pyruvate dehydrogenase [Planctomycetota bacterium]
MLDATLAPAHAPAPALDYRLLERVVRRAFYLHTRMIYDANHRADQEEGDPKIGGHPAACASSLHVLAALHLVVREPQDLLAIKPHAAPVDHALHYLLGLFRDGDGEWMPEEEARGVLGRLRKYAHDGEPVLQSYHAHSDPDSHHFLPTGSVGIPPVVSLYTALAYRYAEDHHLLAPRHAHFWSLIGDSEFREGSLLEALPDAAERELGNCTWIVDYNRQNLDGARMPNNRGLNGTDADRIQRTAEANGWEVLQVRHGALRRSAFERPQGHLLREVLERAFSDYEFQMLLLKRDGALSRRRLLGHEPRLAPLLAEYDDASLQRLLADLGGHELETLVAALRASKNNPRRPTLIVAHTIKGWGLECFAAPGNHSAVPSAAELARLTREAGLDEAAPYATFPAGSAEAQALAERGEYLRRGLEAERSLRDTNLAALCARIDEAGGLPDSVDVNLKMVPLIHTQWMWGQVASKLVRVGNRAEAARQADGSGGATNAARERGLSPEEARWSSVAELLLTMAPDVGASTNLNPIMDDKIYGPAPPAGFSRELTARDPKRPELAPAEAAWTRHLRFEIAEANCMCAAGAFGLMGRHVGIPFLPLMTVYDFFIKRAHDQFFYNLYAGSSFLCIGTPSGVTLSPEGAQHSWKSDFEIPNLLTWEPMFAAELSWILADAVRRHFLRDNAGRTGVLVRAVTKALRQDQLVERLRRHRRFKSDLPAGTLLSTEAGPRPGALHEARVAPLADAGLLAQVKRDCLAGAYYLVDYRGYEGYEPGDNVVYLFALGVMGNEALKASDALLAEGIYANVLVVTSQDLLLGNLAHADDYRHLRTGLAAGEHPRSRPIPVVSVADGEPGLLDNLGGVLGVRQEALAVRRFSKCGRPGEIYGYHGLDAQAIRAAAWRVLEASA